MTNQIYLNGDLFTIEQIKKANQIARKAGYQKATKIILGVKDQVIEHINYGYRKYTTGEYVSAKYRDNFGWKNTYYQHAENIVELKQ